MLKTESSIAATNDRTISGTVGSKTSPYGTYVQGSSNSHYAQMYSDFKNDIHKRDVETLNPQSCENIVRLPYNGTGTYVSSKACGGALNNDQIGAPGMASSDVRSMAHNINKLIHSQGATSGHFNVLCSYNPEQPKPTAEASCGGKTEDPMVYSFSTDPTLVGKSPTANYSLYPQASGVEQQASGFCYPNSFGLPPSPQIFHPNQGALVDGLMPLQPGHGSSNTVYVSQPSGSPGNFVPYNNATKYALHQQDKSISANCPSNSIIVPGVQNGKSLYLMDGLYNRQQYCGREIHPAGLMSSTEYLQRYATQLTGSNFMHGTPVVPQAAIHRTSSNPNTLLFSKSCKLREPFEKNKILRILQLFCSRFSFCGAFQKKVEEQ